MLRSICAFNFPTWIKKHYRLVWSVIVGVAIIGFIYWKDMSLNGVSLGPLSFGIPFEETAAKARNFFKMASDIAYKDNPKAKELYAEAALSFAALAEAKSLDEQTHEYLRGMTTASYFGAGKHLEGLKFLCRMYRSLPHTDHRYRHDMHAHIRTIAFQQGFDTAEKVVADLRYSGCSRDDLNNVWSGIPLSTMRRLATAHTEVGAVSELREEDNVYLQELIRKEPLNPFLDHAYYALGDYDTVISKFPTSYIRDSALLAKAETLLADPGTKPITLLKQYIHEYPNGPRLTFVYNMIVRRLVDTGQTDQALLFLKQNPSAFASVSGNSEAIDPGFPLRYDFYRRGDELASLFNSGNFKEVALILEDFQKRFRGQYGDNYKLTEKLRTPEEFVWIPSFVFDSHQMEDAIGLLKHLAELQSSRDEKQLAYEATLLRDCGAWRSLTKKEESAPEPTPICMKLATVMPDEIIFYSAAASILEELYTITRKGDYLFLSALAHRRFGDYRHYADQLRQFVSESSGQYIDDAETELGWYAMTRGDYPLAEHYLLRVVQLYPESNAYDNALNWLVIMYRLQGRYGKALEYSVKLAENIISSRLISKIGDRTQKLFALDQYIQRNDSYNIGVAASELPINSIEGIVINSFRDGFHPSSKLEVGGNIISVDGVRVGSVDDFLAELRRIKSTTGKNEVTVGYIPPDAYSSEPISVLASDFGI